MITLKKGDCLELMRDIPDASVDFILTDPPYGVTACKWDVVIPLDKMWNQLYRIIKNYAAIVLFGCEPFSSYLRISNAENYKYDFVWKKNKPFGLLHAKNKPMPSHELISIFSKGKVTHIGKS